MPSTSNPSSRPLNAVEQTIHRTAVNNEKKTITQKEIDALVADVNVRAGAINFLLATGMLKMMQGDEISYRAVAKKEMEIKKEMTGDESMVLSHIESAGNRGIWTKHLKAKTELHQTVITRCIKSLEQKGLIKAVDSVEHPTRKMYMMAHLQPAVEVSGGPWYSDKELDTEFIKMLSSACLRFIQEKTFPKTKVNSSHAPLYPVSHSTSYPTAKTIHTWLQKSRLSEQELNVKHVEMLLDVLVYDGQIERLPAYGASGWNMTTMDDDDEEDDDDESDAQSKKRKKKEKAKSRDDKKKKSKGKKRSRDVTSSEEEDDSEDDKRKKKRRKVKGESDGSGEDEERTKKNRKRRRVVAESESSNDSESEEESEEDKKKKKKTKRSSSKASSSKSLKKKKKSKKHAIDSDSSESELDSDHDTNTDDSSDSDSDSKSKSKSKAKRARHKTRKDKEKEYNNKTEPDTSFADGADSTYNSVYRAIRQDRVSLGWSQAPCARCPVFDFCHENGPVNPTECVYYGDWLQQGIASF